MNKKAIMFSIATILVAAVTCFTGTRCFADGEGEEKAIFIGEFPNGPILHAYPTNAASAPVEGVYDKSISTMRLALPKSATFAAVQIENLTTGSTANCQTEVYGGQSDFWLPAGDGVYQIRVLLSDGRYYVGLFEIE
ncbi:MAG: hypothetical protein J6W98_00470 [Bacteroidales bacterium]|nr:hypothetical protein [Bacteroidales bacterium]